MKNLLNDSLNPNDSIFILPTEEGGMEGDNYLASIGDTNLQHIQSLSDAERQVWENFIIMKDGNIFRMEPNPFHRDKDPLNLEGEEDLVKAFETKVLANINKDILENEHIKILREEFDKEAQRRENSKDIFLKRSAVSYEEWKISHENEEPVVFMREEDEDEDEEEYYCEVTESDPEENYYINNDPVPYHKWQEYPQLHRYWDTGPTLKPMFVWSGKARDYLFDQTSEYHPDKQLIEQSLNLLNRDWDEITEDFKEWTVSLLSVMEFKLQGTSLILIDMTEQLATGKRSWGKDTPINPQEAILVNLERIDLDYQKEYQQQVRNKREEDPIHQIITGNEVEWEKSNKEGDSPYKSIKRFGFNLYKHYSKQTSSSHWMRYKTLKKRYSPSINFKNIDFNKSSISKMVNNLNVTPNQAKDIWYARPFDNIGDLNTNCIKPSYLTKNKKTEKLMELIANNFKKALSEEDSRTLTNFGKTIKNLEMKGMVLISIDEWKTVWFYYRVMKGSLFIKLAEIKRQKERFNVKEN